MNVEIFYKAAEAVFQRVSRVNVASAVVKANVLGNFANVPYLRAKAVDNIFTTAQHLKSALRNKPVERVNTAVYRALVTVADDNVNTRTGERGAYAVDESLLLVVAVNIKYFLIWIFAADIFIEIYQLTVKPVGVNSTLAALHFVIRNNTKALELPDNSGSDKRCA